MLIAIREIKVNPGRRVLLPKQLQELIESISAVGLLNPITVDRNYTLIAGLHRLEAMKRLGREEIECTVSSLEGLEAELAEIDENVVRSDVKALDYGDMLLRRKEIYETLHPETKHGMRNGQTSKNRTMRSLEAKSFAEDTADKLGVSRDTVERQIRTAKNLTAEAKEILRDSDTKMTKKDAMKLSRLEPERQREAATLLASGEIKSIDEYKSGSSLHTIPVEHEAEEPIPTKCSGMNLKTEPEPEQPTFLPTAPPVNGSSVFKGITSDLKNEAKDYSCTPGSFLDEFTAFAQKVRQDIAWYSTPYYEAVYPLLTPEQLDCFDRQIRSINTAVQELASRVKGT